MTGKMVGAQVQEAEVKDPAQVVECLPAPEERINIDPIVMSELAELSTEQIEAAMATLRRMMDESRRRDELLKDYLT